MMQVIRIKATAAGTIALCQFPTYWSIRVNGRGIFAGNFKAALRRFNAAG